MAVIDDLSLQRFYHGTKTGRASSDVALTAHSGEDPPVSASPTSPLCSMHTGQNYTSAENSLPQPEQTRLSSIFMA